MDYTGELSGISGDSHVPECDGGTGATWEDSGTAVSSGRPGTLGVPEPIS